MQPQEQPRPRGSVTLEEMTRRRDGWKSRALALQRERDAWAIREASLSRELEETRRLAQHTVSMNHTIRAAVTSTQNEARRYAEECGRLNDQLRAANELAARRQAEIIYLRGPESGSQESRGTEVSEWVRAEDCTSSGNCVEVRHTQDEVLVRNSGDGEDGPVLRFTHDEWDAFLDGVVDGEFDN